MKIIIDLFETFIIFYTLFVLATYGTMLLVSLRVHYRQYGLDKVETSAETIDVFFSKPVSILVPAHNESVGIRQSIRSLLSLNYPLTELIVINDGSTDDTKEQVIKAFMMVKVERQMNTRLATKEVLGIYQSQIHRNLWLIDKERGGKSDALNAGINVSKYPFFCSIDGDSILDKNSLVRVMQPIINSNGKIIATGGSIQIANGQLEDDGSLSNKGLSNRPLVVMQVLEYLRAFYIGRLALSKLNVVLIVSGAFSIFTKKSVLDVGGYSNDMIGEDMELVVKLHRHIKENNLDQRIEYLTDPICWTEAPSDLQTLRKQRRRWHQGLIDSLWKHRKITLNPKYGSIGLVAFPYYILVEALGPLMEFSGYLFVIFAFFSGRIYYEVAVLLALLFILNGVFLTLAGAILEAWSMNRFPKVSDVLKMFLMAVTESIWYRPLTILWRMEGFVRSLSGASDWGQMKRKGLSGTGKGDSM